MKKPRKTKAGVDLKSTLGLPREKKPIWWLAVLEGARFQTFSFSQAKGSLVCQYDNRLPTLREKVAKRLRDSAGRSFESFSRSTGGHRTGPPRHSYTSILTPKEVVQRETALLASRYLEKARRNRAFDALIIVAEKPQLGFLRSHLSQATLKTIEKEIIKTFPHVPDTKKLKLLTSYLPFNAERAPRKLPLIHGA